MKEIPLTQGRIAIVDDEDYDWLNGFKWRISGEGEKRKTVYAVRGEPAIRMHREILGLKYHDGKQCDHIDHNGLNNQRSNLRICTNQQNQFNQRPQERVTASKFKGVSWNRENQKWITSIRVNGQKVYLGSFVDEDAAAKAYNQGAQKHFGIYAHLNILDGGE